MSARATLGVAETRGGTLSVRAIPGEGRHFECGNAQPAEGERILAGLSAAAMALRKVVLPFSRREQIRAVLPQESADSLINRLETPRFAFHATGLENGSRVLYAVCEERRLTVFRSELGRLKLAPGGVVLAELGAWPLLAAEMIPSGQPVLVVDASADPAVVYRLEEGAVVDLRLVSTAATTLGEEALGEELAWLATALVDGVPEERRSTVKKLFLGRSEPFWQPLLALEPLADARRPALVTLGGGLREWCWVRPAGLALAARGEHAQLLDFQEGKGLDVQWREWLSPWRGALILWLVLAVVWGGREGVRYGMAHGRHDRLKQRAEAVFRKTLPRIPVIVDPVLQLQQVLNRAAPESGQGLKPGEWLALIQMRVTSESRVRWLRFRYEAGEVRLEGEVPSYNHLDQVRSALRADPRVREVRMDEAHIVRKSKNVRFRLRLL